MRPSEDSRSGAVLLACSGGFQQKQRAPTRSRQQQQWEQKQRQVAPASAFAAVQQLFADTEQLYQASPRARLLRTACILRWCDLVR